MPQEIRQLEKYRIKCLNTVIFILPIAEYRLLPNQKKAILEIISPTNGFYWDLFPNSIEGNKITGIANSANPD